MRLDSSIDTRVARVQDIRRRIHAGRYDVDGVAFDIASDRLIGVVLAPPATLADDKHLSDVAGQSGEGYRTRIARAMAEARDPDDCVEHAERWE